MVLPIGEFTITDEIEIIDEATLPTRTYKLDFERGRCVGMTDRLEAMEQAVFKALNTNRFENMIYSDDYGFEGMTGEERLFVQAELPRRVKETLLQDGRITSVEDFHLEFDKDNAVASFTAITVYGDVNVLREVINFV